MMYQIECPNCGQQHQFAEESQRPAACRCLYPLASQPAQPVVPLGKIKSIVLVYQKTGEKIEITNVNEVILGRENFGQEVLSKVPQVSRRHCQLKIQDNQVRATDLDSMHGTYIGIDKINCKIQPNSPLVNNGFLYLGHELFLVNIHYQMEEKSKKIIYRCKYCDFEAENFDPNHRICPKTKKYDALEELEVEV